MPVKKKALPKEEPLFFDYHREYDLSKEESEKLVALVATPEFRIFEKYLARKQNKKAHAMVTCDTDERMKELRAQIRGLGEITFDMKFLWDQINRLADKPVLPEL